MQLFYQPDIDVGVDYLEAEESRHCIKVLRKQRHDAIDLVDGKGTFYQAVITDANPRKTIFSITAQRNEASDPYPVHLAVAPTKRMERMEWLVEKATELGAASLTFMDCQHSLRRQLRLDRLQRKAVSAMKQSLKASLPQLLGIKQFNEIVNTSKEDCDHYLAHLGEEAVELSRVKAGGSQAMILIGPEGDFSSSEIDTALQNNFKMVKLGRQRLRTETAALSALITLQLRAGY